MSVSVYTAVNLEPVSCYSCGVIFGLPEGLYRDRRDDHRNWFCPNGHEQHFTGESEAQKLKRLLNLERDTTASLRSRLDGTENQLRATKGVVTKLKKRVVAGACPFGCRRHFADLERHVASKHEGQELPA